jgi:uncharacterized damage-inducible protein DinB
MANDFPSPTNPLASRAEVFTTYLDFFRTGIVERVGRLSEREQRKSRLVSGWSPLELVKHLTYVERRWLEWGFEGRAVADPWGDNRDDRWYVDESESSKDVIAALIERGARSTAIIEQSDLDEVGQPSERWNGASPPTLERILFHLLQEYARHLGHLDIVVEMAGGETGE